MTEKQEKRIKDAMRAAMKEVVDKGGVIDEWLPKVVIAAIEEYEKSKQKTDFESIAKMAKAKNAIIGEIREYKNQLKDPNIDENERQRAERIIDKLMLHLSLPCVGFISTQGPSNTLKTV